VTELDRIAATGMKALFGRQALVQLFTFAGGVVLARTLGPAQFGLFFIAAFLANAVATLGDFGLGPSLIQRREDLQQRDLQAAFTLQLAATSLVFVIVALGAPLLVRLYPHAPAATVWLVRALAFNFFLTTWRSVGFLQLERDLRYRRVALIETVEALLFQGIAVVLALAGAGAWSFVAATLASGVTGTALSYVSARWRFALVVDRERYRELLRFGIPYQAQMVLNSLGGWASMFLMGGLFGARGVGLISWASANGRKPSVFIDNVSRVAFPHLSRQQDDPAAVERTITGYLGALLCVSGLWTLILGLSAWGVVPLVYTSKWSAAIPALVVFAVALLFDTTCVLFVVTLNSQGSPMIVARATMVRSVVMAGLAVGFGLWFGFVGFAVAHLVSSVATTFVLGRRIRGIHRVMAAQRWLLWPAIATAAAGAGVLAFPLADPARSLVAACVVSTVYGLVVRRTMPQAMAAGLRALVPVRRRGPAIERVQTVPEPSP
jgi:PST family polysaccharide transporter